MKLKKNKLLLRSRVLVPDPVFIWNQHKNAKRELSSTQGKDLRIQSFTYQMYQSMFYYS